MVAPIVTLAVFFGVFGLIYTGKVDRRAVTLIGGGVILFAGLIFDFFSFHMAIDAIYYETLALIFGMSLISSTLARSGLFSVIAGRAAVYSKGNGWLILILFSLLTYCLSLFVNNLATIVVLVPVALNICRVSGFNPVPILIAMIISSNLGGASTMVGDFPNMIISSAADLHFLDFIQGMMVPCLILFAAMFILFQWRRRELNSHSIPAKDRKKKIENLFKDSDKDIIEDDYLYRIGLSVLLLVVIGFLFSEYFDARPAYIAFAAGLMLIVIGRFKKDDLFDSCGTGDILFFTGLFVMVGGLNAAGVLDWFSSLIEILGAGVPAYELLALMWIAGFTTIFLNAGPSTAFFIPIASQMSYYIPGHAVWWALSLGVLAGSSAALTGATAGSVAASQLDKAIKDFPEIAKQIPSGRSLDFKEFIRWGFPVMIIFLTLSTFYILIIAPD